MRYAPSGFKQAVFKRMTDFKIERVVQLFFVEMCLAFLKDVLIINL